MDPEKLRHLLSLVAVLNNQLARCWDIEHATARGENPTTTLAQQTALMQETVTVLENLCRDIILPGDDLNATISILIQHTELTPIQRIRIADYLAVPEHKNLAVLFRAFDRDVRKLWLARRLAEIAGDEPDV